MSNSVRALDPLAVIAGFGVQPRPPATLDRALDATERCVAQHGVRRTTMSDIAKEMGVSRPTLYKQLSSVEEAVALVVARQLHRFLDELSALLVQAPGPDTFIEMGVRAVEFARAHPVTERVLTLEPDLVGRAITTGQLSSYVEQVTDLVTPVVRRAMKRGDVRSGDARVTAAVIVRLCGSLMLSPGADPAALIRGALTALLAPDR